MRDKIIKRFAAGTIGVCFAYALIRQPFAAMNNPSELITVDRSVATQSVTQPTTAYPVTTVPPTEIKITDPPTEETVEQPEMEAITEPLQEEIIEDNESSENESDEELQPQQNESGGDVPSLTQFLSTLICGGCRHNCSLVSPRCMKGRAKAESATVEYYETYGA